MLEKKIKKEFLLYSKINVEDKIIKKSLNELVKNALKYYLSNLRDKKANNLYELVLTELEPPLLDIVMQYTRGNQTQAALIMGINRSTLRKKLKKYSMN
ncbi:DNA-binding transcriptional regulator Fis [Buchnera aphidicola]|uniref:Putative Fis-like DNA-binding protein n=1 Tax=Buchnera aphidicola str. Ua (Uroleucon ambrosiae) TaxID=1005057 RepID=G2LPP9_BUCUM|nr:DNA-binding transcriptional regulator Fis [Buchnera aphidicola]AEO08186.1 factor-for-inversion stimulation protein [Buchnera aphidicola str. Ua (Uroleucon ambrosiae)]